MPRWPEKQKGQVEEPAAPGRIIHAPEAREPNRAGLVRLYVPEGVTAISGVEIMDGVCYVTPALAETLVGMHGFRYGLKV